MYYEVKTITFVDIDTNAAANDAEGSTIALCEHC